MTEPPRPPVSPLAGPIVLVLGVVALALYAFVGVTAVEDAGGVPASRFLLAALLVVTGVALRAADPPRWAVFVAAALAGLIAFDLLLLFA